MFEEEGADSVRVAEDGDLGRGLDEADQLVGAARDDEVDVLVQGEELGDHVAGFDELDGVVGDLGGGEGGGDDGGDGDEGFGGFFASWGVGVSIIGGRGMSGDEPLRMAALPDLIARAAMLAMTSGRASKMMRRTPMGQVTLSRSKPSSRRVRRVTFPTTQSTCQYIIFATPKSA